MKKIVFFRHVALFWKTASGGRQAMALLWQAKNAFTYHDHLSAQALLDESVPFCLLLCFFFYAPPTTFSVITTCTLAYSHLFLSKKWDIFGYFKKFLESNFWCILMVFFDKIIPFRSLCIFISKRAQCADVSRLFSPIFCGWDFAILIAVCSHLDVSVCVPFETQLCSMKRTNLSWPDIWHQVDVWQRKRN